MSTPDEAPEAPDLDVAPLSRWERLGASLAGIILAGAGGAAVFITNNQAGSVALLLVGALLLVMAINGSPLTRARVQENEVWMSRRRRQIVASIEQENPQDARQALQMLSTLDPRATNDPVVTQVSAAIYEREIFERIVRIYPETRQLDGPGDVGFDLTLQTSGVLIGVQIKAGRAVLATSGLRGIVDAALSSRDRGEGPIDGLLVVTNRPLFAHLPRRIREYSREFLPVSVVRWIDEQDDAALEASIRMLVSRLNLQD